MSTWTPTLEFSDRLRIVRHKRKQTIEQIAAECGIPFRTWATWEAGAKPRDLVGVISKIADATEVSREWLMWGDGATTVTAGVTGREPNQRLFDVAPFDDRVYELPRTLPEVAYAEAV